MDIVKVLHIITELELGGAQLFTLKTVKELDPNLFNTYLIANCKGLLNDRVSFYTKNFDCIPSLIREISPLKDLITLYKLYKKIKKIKPLIVHTHSSKAGILGRWAAFFAKVPIIIHTVHGFAFSPYHSKFRRSFYIFLEKLTGIITDFHIFVSDDNKKEAIKLNISKEEKSDVIRSIVSLEKFFNNRNKKKSLREKWKFPENKFIVGGVFCFKPQKDPVGFIEIANLVLKENKNFEFVIAGDGYVKDAMLRKIEEYGLKDKIKILGWVNNPEELIPAFDILLLPSLWEGLPQVVVQAIVSKVPVIATSVNGTKEIVKNGESGFTFSPKDYERAAELIINLFKNRFSDKKLESESLRIFNEFNPDRMVEKQKELYLNLLKNVK